MVPNNSWLAPYRKNFSGVKLVQPAACAWQAALSSSDAGELPAGNSSGMRYCAMSVCGGNTSHLQVVFNNSLIKSNLFNGDPFASHPYLLCLQGLADVTFSSAVVSGNQYVTGGVDHNPYLSSIMAVDRGVVFNCINCLFVQNYGARPLAVWGNASLSQTNISKNWIGEDFFRGSTDTGAILVEQGANLHANGCTFSENDGADNGSAVYAKGRVIIDNCTFDRNRAGSNGGAIRGGGAPMRITNSKFDGNSAGSGVGGALAFIAQGLGMDLRIESCSFSRNFAGTRGGGIGVQYDMVGPGDVVGPSDEYGEYDVEYDVQYDMVGPYDESGEENVMHRLRIADTTMHGNSVVGQGSCVSFIVDSDEYTNLYMKTHGLDFTNYSIENSTMTSNYFMKNSTMTTIHLSLQVPSTTLQLYNVTVDDNAGSGIQADLAENSTLLVNKS